MNGKITALLVESDPQVTQLLLLLLAGPGWPPLSFTLVCVDGLEAARAALNEDDSLEVVLLDISAGALNPLEALRRVRTHAPALPVVALVGAGEESLGLEAVRAGAQDYQVKGSLDARELKHALCCAVLRQRPAPRREPRRRFAHA